MTRKNPERYQELMRVAQQLFYTNGYENTSINDIIKVANVSKGALYHHFSSKSDILEAIIKELIDQAATALQHITTDTSLSAIVKMQKVIRLSHSWQLEMGVEITEIGRILRSDENVLLHHKLRVAWMKICTPEIARIINQGVSEGVFSVEHVLETAHTLIVIIESLNEEIDQLIVDREKLDNPLLVASNKFGAMQVIIERLLGASKGTIPLVGSEALINWFNNA